MNKIEKKFNAFVVIYIIIVVVVFFVYNTLNNIEEIKIVIIEKREYNIYIDINREIKTYKLY